ncbi:hypothetical protein MD484_g594, partial [Candolleomyces efflorescens]
MTHLPTPPLYNPVSNTHLTLEIALMLHTGNAGVNSQPLPDRKRGRTVARKSHPLPPDVAPDAPSDEEPTTRKRRKTATSKSQRPMSTRARGKQRESAPPAPPVYTSQPSGSVPIRAEEEEMEEDIREEGSVNLDEYDLEDDFIDDSEIVPGDENVDESTPPVASVAKDYSPGPAHGGNSIHRVPTHQARTSPLKRMGAVMSIDDPGRSLITPPHTPLNADQARTLQASPASPSLRQRGRTSFRPPPSPLAPSHSTPRSTFAANASAFAMASQSIGLASPFSTPTTPNPQSSTNLSTQMPTTPGPSPLSPHTPGSSRTRRAFRSVVSQDVALAVPTQPPLEQTTLGDGIYRRVTALPSQCQVTDTNLQDPLLAQCYIGLPPLRRGMFQPWTDNAGQGMVQFSMWAEKCPGMSFDSCMSAIEFRAFDVYLNPSRASPLDFCVREFPGSRPRFHLYTADRRPAVCVSTILCRESHLVEPSNRGLRQKEVQGVQHSQEWERSVAFQCTMFGHDLLWAQLGMDSMQYSTKADFSQRESPSQSQGSKNMYSNTRSPSVASRSRGGAIASNDNFTLDWDAEGMSLYFNLTSPTTSDSIRHSPRL